MKILHILNDGPTALSDQIIAVQSKEHQVKVIDLTKNSLYENIVEDIFSHDRVVSW